jgi:hypothetical protein
LQQHLKLIYPAWETTATKVPTFLEKAQLVENELHLAYNLLHIINIPVFANILTCEDSAFGVR